MIAIPIATGTRVCAVVPLIDEATGASLVDEAGVVVTMSVRWPDHPKVARARLAWLAHQSAVDRAQALPGGLEALAPMALVDLIAPRDEAMVAYAAALVVRWSQAAPCTPDAVSELFADNPFALGLVLAASGDADRFLPEPLRPLPVASAPLSEAVA